MSSNPAPHVPVPPPVAIADVFSSAMQMEGMVLDGRWTVGPRLIKRPNATGGNFSHCYPVTGENGRKAFLKALDMYKAFMPGANPTRIIQEVTEAHNFEIDLLAICDGHGMDRVVRAIADGTAVVDSSTPLGQVPFIVFEAADCDVRAHLDNMQEHGGTAWKLRAIHHIATGLKQLHAADIAHQDVKPSNVLVFQAGARDSVCKLGDLGRASLKGRNARHDSSNFPGDPTYAPPEFIYNHIPADWNFRRINADLYMLGSLISFLFAGTTAFALLLSKLPLEAWPGNWGGKFEEVLPHLQNAFSESIVAFSGAIQEDWLKAELSEIFAQLCSPDPSRRGQPGRPVNALSLETYVTKFDRLARRGAAEARETTQWRQQ